MAAASESDDASDIFWPGYVDAVTNLAINLLFVIAVMSIVVLATTLQISQMKPQSDGKDKSAPLTQSSTGQPRSTQNADKHGPDDRQRIIENQARTIEQLQRRLAQLQLAAGTPPASKATVARDSEAGTTADQSGRADVVMAQQRTRESSRGASQLSNLSAGGVVVVFASDVIELAEAEAAELVKKLTANAPIKGGRWELRVVTPKGFSEASRIAYYRVSNLRNVLIKNGAAPADIDMRVIEAPGANANNARVLVRLLP